MKAIIYTKYGSPDNVLELKEVEKPIPSDDQVLIKVQAASVNHTDWYLVTGEPYIVRFWSGFLEPKNKIPGGDIAGRVEAVGVNVKQFQPGGEVFGDKAASGHGAWAEYVCAYENELALKPANITFEEAAAVPQAAVSALQALRDVGQIQPGQKVLINGASGGVGTFAVQIAKSFQTEVTGVCSTSKMEMVRSIGADHVIDYTQEDFTKNEQRYDLILGVGGYHPISDYKRALSPEGIYVMIGGSTAQKSQAVLQSPFSKKVGNLMGKPNQKDLTFIKGLLEAGKVIPVIDRCYPLNEAAEAFRYFGEGHTQGKIVITMEHNDNK